MAFEVERAKASQQRDLFEAALERAASQVEKTHLAARLAETQERLSQIEHEDSSADTSAVLAWGAIAIARMSASSNGIHEKIIVCGGVEALAVALRKCRTHDKPAVLQAMQRMIAAAPRLQSMRAILGPTLVMMKAHSQNRLVQVQGLGVVLAFAQDAWSHAIIESHLATIIRAMDQYEHDAFVQELGLDVVFHIVDSEERELEGGAEGRYKNYSCFFCLGLVRPLILLLPI